MVVDVIGEACDLITSAAECTAAYKELGIIQAIDDALSGDAGVPPYCYIKHGRLKFNTDGTNTGLCDDTGRECVCIEGNNFYHKNVVSCLNG